MPKYQLTRLDSAQEAEQYREIILGLWKRNLPKLTPDCFDWIYKHNPQGAAKTVLAKDLDTGEYVGCAAVLPKSVTVLGKSKKCGMLINFATDAGHRTFGPALAMQKEIVSAYLTGVFDFIYGYPNRDSEGIFKRLGYSFVGTGDYYARVVDWRSKIVVAGSLLNWSFSIVEWFQLARKKSHFKTRISQGLSLEESRQLAELGERDPAYIQWRYQEVEYSARKFFCVTDCNDKLIGCIIYQNNSGWVNIDDFLTSDTRNVGTVIGLFIDWLKTTNCKTVTAVYMGNRDLSLKLRKVFFISKKDNRPVLIAFGDCLNEAEKRSLLDRNHWHAFDGELDI